MGKRSKPRGRRFAVHGSGRIAGNPPVDVLGIIRRLRALAADPLLHRADRTEARGRARELAKTVGRLRRRERG